MARILRYRLVRQQFLTELPFGYHDLFIFLHRQFECSDVLATGTAVHIKMITFASCREPVAEHLAALPLVKSTNNYFRLFQWDPTWAWANHQWVNRYQQVNINKPTCWFRIIPGCHYHLRTPNFFGDSKWEYWLPLCRDSWTRMRMAL